MEGELEGLKEALYDAVRYLYGDASCKIRYSNQICYAHPSWSLRRLGNNSVVLSFRNLTDFAPELDEEKSDIVDYYKYIENNYSKFVESANLAFLYGLPAVEYV